MSPPPDTLSHNLVPQTIWHGHGSGPSSWRLCSHLYVLLLLLYRAPHSRELLLYIALYSMHLMSYVPVSPARVTYLPDAAKLPTGNFKWVNTVANMPLGAGRWVLSPWISSRSATMPSTKYIQIKTEIPADTTYNTVTRSLLQTSSIFCYNWRDQ